MDRLLQGPERAARVQHVFGGGSEGAPSGLRPRYTEAAADSTE